MEPQIVDAVLEILLRGNFLRAKPGNAASY